MLLQQADKLLIGPLTTPIMEQFNLNRAQMGFVTTGALLKSAFLIICVSTWVLCFFFFLITARVIPQDIATLRQQMRQRADYERSLQANP